MVTHCIFDMDGLLLDTESLYTRVQQDICARFGKDFTWELKAKIDMVCCESSIALGKHPGGHVRVQMMGRKALPAAEALIEDLNLHGQITPEEFVKQREEKLHALFPECQALPGVERLLAHLKRTQVPICVATSSHQRHFELKTCKHKELFALFDHVITGDQVTAGKPAPDIFQKAAAQWSPVPEPGRCLVFEDAPLGVQAAVAAGMQVVMVPDSNLSVSETVGATEVLQGMRDFVPEKFGLPAFRIGGIDQ